MADRSTVVAIPGLEDRVVVGAIRDRRAFAERPQAGAGIRNLDVRPV